MNYSTAIFLINKNARAIKAIYEVGERVVPELFKTLDQNIKVDDMVVVQTASRHGMTVCKVTEVDVDFDLESTAEVRWIIDTVKTEQHASYLTKEQEAISAIKKAQLRQKRDDLRNALFKDHAETLNELSISDMGEPAKLAAPAPETKTA